MATEFGSAQRQLLETRCLDAVRHGGRRRAHRRGRPAHRRPGIAARGVRAPGRPRAPDPRPGPQGLPARRPDHRAGACRRPDGPGGRAPARGVEPVGRRLQWPRPDLPSVARPRHPVTEIRGLDNINRFLIATVEDAQHEILTAQPTLGRYHGSLENAPDRDIRAVQRGISMRTLYQHSARRSVAIKEYVDRLSRYGAQVRTLEEFFNRMIVIDRQIAIVPGADGNDVAIAIHEPSLVAYLADVFERYWERARALRRPSREHRARHRRGRAQHDRPDADRGPQRPRQRQAGRRQHAHVCRLHRLAQGGVRRADPVPARLRDGPRRP